MEVKHYDLVTDKVVFTRPLEKKNDHVYQFFMRSTDLKNTAKGIYIAVNFSGEECSWGEIFLEFESQVGFIYSHDMFPSSAKQLKKSVSFDKKDHVKYFLTNNIVTDTEDHSGTLRR